MPQLPWLTFSFYKIKQVYKISQLYIFLVGEWDKGTYKMTNKIGFNLNNNKMVLD